MLPALNSHAPGVKTLFAARILRMTGYGLLSVILAVYLAALGLPATRIGALLTLTLLGDTVISLWMTTWADRLGRRRMLVAGAVLMCFAGVTFALTHNFFAMLAAAIIGVISPSGNEVGPFLSIEQAALSQSVPEASRTRVFAWYNLAGSFAGAIGALLAGGLMQGAAWAGIGLLARYQIILVLYGVIGLLLAVLFLKLPPSVEVDAPGKMEGGIASRLLGIHHSRCVVLKLAGLFSIDAFAGGFVMQSFMAYWFHIRFGVAPGLLGAIFFGANLLAGISALSAAKLANRIGLINTMVFTHLPSNVLLILVPLMPNLKLAIAVLLMRFAISQMDVPTRQAYTVSVVRPEERSAASGITGTARTIGAGLAPVLAGPLFASATLLSAPFFVAGGLKIVYDLLLYRSFKSLRK